ncbi:MAG TPA: hypothetical protein VD772_04415, partial [Anseongella sp.]|nr:hypothetical protein [Anseongella sp.]
PRILLSAEARHPQMVSLPDGETAIVWEERALKESGHAGGIRGAEGSGMSHSGHSSGKPGKLAHSGHPGNGNAAPSVIVLQIRSASGETKSIKLTGEKQSAHHPVLAASGPQSLLVAWVKDGNAGSGIRYSTIDLGRFRE